MHKQGREGKTRLQKHETKSENVHGEGSHGQYSQHDSCILENRPSPQLGMEKKKKKEKPLSTREMRIPARQNQKKLDIWRRNRKSK